MDAVLGFRCELGTLASPPKHLAVPRFCSALFPRWLSSKSAGGTFPMSGFGAALVNVEASMPPSVRRWAECGAAGASSWAAVSPKLAAGSAAARVKHVFGKVIKQFAGKDAVKRAV